MSTVRRRPDVLVLCYHAISDAWEDALAVRPAELEQQVEGLLRRGYAATTFTRAVLDPPTARTLAVTFDDACVSVVAAALPVLQRLGVPATVFAPSKWVGVAGPMVWDGIDDRAVGVGASELRCLDWSALRRLRAADWEIGSHTVTHPRLPGLDPVASDTELRTSRRALEAGIGAPVTSVAYPYGAVDARVEHGARVAGYLAAAGLPPSPHRPRPLCWPRVGVYRRDGPARFRVKTDTTVRRGRPVLGR